MEYTKITKRRNAKLFKKPTPRRNQQANGNRMDSEMDAGAHGK